jgi:uncharacterized membrane-anchored protein
LADEDLRDDGGRNRRRSGVDDAEGRYAVSSLILLGFFVFTLIAQLRSKRFHPALYWLVILSTSTAGTTLSDFMDRSLGLGYAMGATIIASVLIAVLAAWRWKYGSLKVDHIREPGVETFYWLAILASNTLGTALGDFLADTSGLGYLWSNVVISGGILATILAWKFTRISTTVLFWIAFVLTRPFGATMGDLLTKSHAKGGLDLGAIGSTAALLSLLVVLLIATTADYRKWFTGAHPA